MVDMAKIPSNRHPQLLGQILHTAVNKISVSGRVTKGEYVKEFEEVVKGYYDVEHAITFGSGTMAHFAAAQSLKVEPYRPDRMILPAFSYSTIPWTLKIAGFEPIYRDINPDTYHFEYDDQNDWYEYVTFMDTYGSICDIDIHDPYLCIIDACHSFGVPRKHLRGRGEVFSFNGGKLFTTGEGGMVITNDSYYAKSVEKIRDQVARMPELSGAMGLEFMECIDEILGQREQNANYYTENLRTEYVPQDIPIATNNYMYAVRTKYRDVLVDGLQDEIALRYYYYPPLAELPNTILVGQEHMILPNGVNMFREVEQVTEVLNNIMDMLVETE